MLQSNLQLPLSNHKAGAVTRSCSVSKGRFNFEGMFSEMLVRALQLLCKVSGRAGEAIASLSTGGDVSRAVEELALFFTDWGRCQRHEGDGSPCLSHGCSL